MAPLEIMTAAIKLIETYGLAHGQFGYPDVGFSIVGALATAAKLPPELAYRSYQDPTVRACRNAVWSVLTANGGDPDSIMSWQDTHTKEDVLAVLAQASKVLA